MDSSGKTKLVESLSAVLVKIGVMDTSKKVKKITSKGGESLSLFYKFV